MKAENMLNILHYCIYRGDYKLRLLFNKVNPFMLIHKLPFLKRRYEKLGIDINEVVNQSFSDKRYGLSIMVAGGAIVGILFILLMAIALTVVKITNLELELSAIHFIVFILSSTGFCYFLVFKSDKYRRYFDVYESWTKGEKKKYGWCSLIFIVGVIVLFIWSL